MYFHLSTCGPNVEAFRRVFAAAIAHAVRNGISNVVIAVHAKGNLDGVISDAIGEGAASKLQKGRTIQTSGVTLWLATERIAFPSIGKAVFIAAHTSTKYLKAIESHRSCEAVFFAPWTDDELADYVRRHQSTEVAAASSA